MSTLKLQVRTTFGRDLIYPVCDTSMMLARLVGAKTLSPEQVAILVRLGYAVEYVAQVPQGTLIGGT